MRPVTERQTTIGVTPWIPMNRIQWVTNVGLAVSLSSGASLIYSVEHTFDDIWAVDTNITITRTTTSANVYQPNHGLSVSDWIKVTNAGAPLDGEFSVTSVVDANNFTYTVTNSGVATGSNSSGLQKGRIFTHAILVNKTVSADSNYAFPCIACRLHITTYGSGFADLTVLQGN